jgi:hypothetical protein
VPFSILAGDGNPLKGSCTGAAPNDGVVSVTSAEWTISDQIVEPLIHTSETGSPTAFSSWVMPHLALGPTAAGGGNYVGPLAASIASVRRADIATRKSLPATRVHALTRTSRKRAAAKFCLATLPAPSLSAGGEQTVRSAHTSKLSFTVPAHSGDIDAIVLAPSTVTTKLVDPRGKVLATIAGGSAAGDGLFRTLTASASEPGVWHLDATEASAGAATQIEVAIHLTRSPLKAKLTLSEKKSKARNARRTLVFTARVNAGGAAERSATVTLILALTGRRPLRLRLRALAKHPGSYRATTAADITAATGLLMRVNSHANITSAQDELKPCR